MYHSDLLFSLFSFTCFLLLGCRARMGSSKLPSLRQPSPWCTAFQSWWSAQRSVWRLITFRTDQCRASSSHLEHMWSYPVLICMCVACLIQWNVLWKHLHNLFFFSCVGEFSGQNGNSLNLQIKSLVLIIKAIAHYLEQTEDGFVH